MEVNTGLICGCKIALRPLLQRKRSRDANVIQIDELKRATEPACRQRVDKTETDKTEPDSNEGNLLESMDREWGARGWTDPSAV